MEGKNNTQQTLRNLCFYVNKTKETTRCVTLYVVSFIFSQDGHPIDDITWMRYRKNKNVLKVRNANHDDTGIYTCKGINGFGSSEARIEVIIVGEFLGGHIESLI